MTLAKTISIYRTDEITKLQMKEMSIDKEVNGIKKKYGKTSRHKNQGGTNQMSKSNQKPGTNQNSNGKKCKFCEQIQKPRERPAYGQECHKCKKKNQWANCSQTKILISSKMWQG